MHRTVSARLTLDIASDAVLALLLAVADGPYRRTDQLRVTLDGRDLDVQELTAPHGTRLHRVESPAGRVEIAYEARVEGAGPSGWAVDADPVDQLRYLRPSRYAESDEIFGFARSLFGGLVGVELVHAVRSWVTGNVQYVLGSSAPTDGAARTVLAGAGVCRDFAHVVVACLRALDVPARLVSVYAPGLKPMDFHAVAEAFVDGAWHLVDATGLAPRQSMLRIATGSDAADTAFLSAHGGRVDLLSLEVLATTDADLPVDSPEELVTL